MQMKRCVVCGASSHYCLWNTITIYFLKQSTTTAVCLHLTSFAFLYASAYKRDKFVRSIANSTNIVLSFCVVCTSRIVSLFHCNFFVLCSFIVVCCQSLTNKDSYINTMTTIPSLAGPLPCRSGLVVSASDCGVKGPRFESHRGLLCLSWQPLRYRALGTGCAPLLQCLGRLSRLPSVGR